MSLKELDNIVDILIILKNVECEIDYKIFPNIVWGHEGSQVIQLLPISKLI